jgi:hypothetical protein
MTIRDLFKKQKMGPLSASPVGLILFCSFVAASLFYSYSIARDRANADLFSEAIHFAEPITIQARWIYEKTGKWPTSLDDPRFAQEPMPEKTFQLQFLQKQGVRVLLSRSTSMTLRVIVRGEDRFLTCESAELPIEQVPRFCREKNTKVPESPL